jgi:hypothetical protein
MLFLVPDPQGNDQRLHNSVPCSQDGALPLEQKRTHCVERKAELALRIRSALDAAT